jgi:hypothetical protein
MEAVSAEGEPALRKAFVAGIEEHALEVKHPDI